MTNTTAPPGTRRGDMTASAFLSEMWCGPQVPGLLTTWELARKRTYYWPTTHVGEFHDQAPDVFFGVGSTREDRGKGRRPRVNEICALAGVFLDIDGFSPYVDGTAAVLDWSEYTSIPPTMIVDSGHGIHAYHLFTEGPWIFRTLAERDSAIDLVRRWVHLHPAADRNASDLARVMRLPGTVNNKDPLNPRAVRVISHGGPRHRVSDLLDLVRDVPGDIIRGLTSGPFSIGDLRGDTSGFVAKLDALLDLSPEFERRWAHTEAPADNSLSAYDLSLCTLAAGAMTDAELAKLIDMHRCQWGTGDDIIKGHRDTYLRQTIGKARANANRDSAMRELER